MSTLRILHISDLHISSRGVPEIIDDCERFNGLAAAAAADQCQVMLEALKDLGDKNPIDAIVVSGDLVNKGGIETSKNGSEFDKARAFLIALQEQLKVRREHVLIVPGNHDVDWSGDRPQYERFSAFRKTFGGLFTIPHFEEEGPELRSHVLSRDGVDVDISLLISPTFSGAREEDPKEVMKRYLTHLEELGSDAVFLREGAAPDGEQRKSIQDLLNKAVLNRRPFDIALIGAKQREMLRAAVSGNIDSQVIRIGVLHHHLLPDPGIELGYFESVVDSGRVLQTLIDCQFDLVLTGHKHNRRLVQYRPRNADARQSSDENEQEDPDEAQELDYTATSERGIDIYSAPSLFELRGGSGMQGPTLIEIHGGDSKHYATIRHFWFNSKSGRLGREEEEKKRPLASFTKYLTRGNEGAARLIRLCHELSASDRDHLLLPTVYALTKSMRWPRRTNIEWLPDFVRWLWEMKLKEEIESFDDEELVFQPSGYEEKWSKLLSLANGSSLRLVSYGEGRIWEELANSDQEERENSAAYRYHVPMMDFKGEKKRLIVLTREEFERSKENWNKVVQFMSEEVDLEVSFVETSTAMKCEPADFVPANFGIIGEYCVIFGQEPQNPFGVKSRYSFKQENLEKATRKWNALSGEAKTWA